MPSLPRAKNFRISPERETGRSILGPFKLLIFSGRMATKVETRFHQIQEIPFLCGHLQFCQQDGCFIYH